MTISSVVKTTGNLPGDGSTYTFSFSPIKMSKASEIRVYHVVTATGVETEIFEGVSATTFLINAITYPGTGSIQYPADGTSTQVPSTETILIKRIPAQEQETEQLCAGRCKFYADFAQRRRCRGDLKY